jgi:hypothetical protein
LAKSNFEEEPAVVEVRKLREEVESLKELILSLHRALAEGKGDGKGGEGEGEEIEDLTGFS